MTRKTLGFGAVVIVIFAAGLALCAPTSAPSHQCDPVDPISDVGWSVTSSLETVGALESSPYQAETIGDWFVERVTTRIPFCNYYNEIGIYSMRSYTLAPEITKEQILICEHNKEGHSGPVSPYAGPCPPK